MPVLADTMMTVFGVVLVLVMVSGYVAIWALWHFVFSKAPPDDPRQQEQPTTTPEVK
jgi:hypothetical protein